MVWRVVKAFDSNGGATFYTVPDSWVDLFEGQYFVYYPKPGEMKDVTKYIVANKSPKKDVWSDTAAAVIPTKFNTFLEARTVEAEVFKDETKWTSYVTEGVAPKQYGLGHRAKVTRKIRLPGEKSTTERDSSSDETSNEHETSTDFPSPPKKQKNSLGPDVDDARRDLFGTLPSKSPQKEGENQQKKKSPAKDFPKGSSKGKSVGSGTSQPSTSRDTNVPFQPVRTRAPISKKGETAPEGSKTPNGSKTPIPNASPRTPKRSSARTAAKTPSRTPAKTPSRTPAKTPSRTPAKTPSRTPARTPSRTSTVRADIGKGSDTITVSVEPDIFFGDQELAEALNIESSKTASTVETNKSELSASFDRKFQIFVIRKLKSIEQQVSKLVTARQVLAGAEGQLKFKIPCTSYKKVFVMDDVLKKDETQFELLVSHLSSQPNPSSSHAIAVNAILRTVMKDSVASEFCYTGSENKLEFKNFKIVDAVLAAVRTALNNETLSSSVISKDIAEWLRQADNRVGGKAGRKNAEPRPKRKKVKRKRPATLETSQSELEIP